MMRCAITDVSSLPSAAARRSALLASATRWAATNIDLVQLREKSLDAGELVALARDLLALFHATPGCHTRLLINARPDIAIAAHADGVQLSARPGSLTPAQARRVFAASSSPNPLISLSCHTLDEVRHAVTSAADLILFAPVFEKQITDTLTLPGTGLDLLHEACLAAAPIPVLALGGVTPQNTGACIAAGAAGIAGIRLFY